MKKTLLTLLQILVTLAILYWVFHKPEKRAQMAQALHYVVQNQTWPWFIVGAAAYGIVEVLAAIRWGILLRVQDIILTKTRLVSLLMIGIFFNLFMPGGNGGDVVKIYYLLKETPKKKAQALLAVLMDRLFGLIGLMIVAVFFIVLRYDWLTHGDTLPPFKAAWLVHPGDFLAWFNHIPPSLKWLYMLLLILGASVLAIVTSFVISGLGLANRLPKHFPFHEKLIELSAAYNLYARAWKPSLAALVLSFGVHIFSFLVFYYAARAFYHAKVLDYFAIMPIVNTITAIPISVSGVGVRETLFQDLLGQLCHVDAGTAVMISISGFLLMAFWGVVGCIIYIFYRPSEHARLGEIKTTVAALEHQIAEDETR